MMMLTIVPLSLLLLAGSCLGQGFGYGEDNGPATWANDNPTCNGTRQSPINIETSAVQKKELPPLILKGKCKLQTMSIVNNGHTVMMKSEESCNGLPTVFGGPLGKNIYKFEQLHFHWGKDNSEGSENTINNKSYTMEMHAVFYKEEYGSLNNAVKYDDGLTVLGYWFEVSSYTRCKSLGTKIIQRIVDTLPKIEEPNGEERIIKSFPLLDLLYPDGQYYYTYNGSLTTPPCSEIVTWIVFEQPKTVCNFQTPPFRKLRSEDGYMTNNFRPVQPLENRVVVQNIPNSKSRPRSGQANRKEIFPWLNILGAICIAII